jgi:predicted phage terminase large subunit-like protein
MTNSQDISPSEAAKELLRRRKIRRSLTEYARHKGFEPALHHRLIIDEIEAFLASDDEVLLLFAPPGSAKSTYVSNLFPPHYLSQNPGHSILAATHSVEFAQRWGRKCRNDIASDGHVLGISLAGDSTAADRWALTTGGEYYGVGAGVGISGFRADLGLADDLFGSREDAYSETVRKKRWDWYTDDFSARLKPHAKRILMNTRWHPEDVAGRILQQIEKGQVKGRVVSLPAIAEANDPLGRAIGEPLWADDPAWDYPSYLRSRKAEISPMMWAALFQQRPAPEEGSFFQRGWFKRYEPAARPAFLHVYGSSDYAVTEDGGDYTVHRVWGVDHSGGLWLLAGWRGQSTADVWIERLIDLVIQHKPLAWFGEGGVIAKAIEPMLRRRLRERNAGCRLEWLPSINDKPTRARGFQARAAMGRVNLPEGTEGDLILDEYLHFPAGKHDDEVDTASLIGRALDETHPAIVTGTDVSRNPPDLNRWRRDRETESDWRTA